MRGLKDNGNKRPEKNLRNLRKRRADARRATFEAMLPKDKALAKWRNRQAYIAKKTNAAGVRA